MAGLISRNFIWKEWNPSLPVKYPPLVLTYPGEIFLGGVVIIFCVLREKLFLKFSNCQVRSNFFGNIAVKTELEQKFHRLKIMLSVISLQTDGIFINCCIISIYPKIKGWVLIREAILGILWIKKTQLLFCLANSHVLGMLYSLKQFVYLN